MYKHMGKRGVPQSQKDSQRCGYIKALKYLKALEQSKHCIEKLVHKNCLLGERYLATTWQALCQFFLERLWSSF